MTALYVLLALAVFWSSYWLIERACRRDEFPAITERARVSAALKTSAAVRATGCYGASRRVAAADPFEPASRRLVAAGVGAGSSLDPTGSRIHAMTGSTPPPRSGRGGGRVAQRDTAALS